MSNQGAPRPWLFGIGTVGLVFGLVWYVTGGFHIRTVSDLLPLMGDFAPHENTFALCVQSELKCVEGYSTSIGNFIRFQTTEESDAMVVKLGKFGMRNGPMVFDFSEVEIKSGEIRRGFEILNSEKDWD